MTNEPYKTVEPMTAAPVSGLLQSGIVGGAPVMAHLLRSRTRMSTRKGLLQARVKA